MILEFSRGRIKVKVMDRIATVQSEMYLPGNDRFGFVVYSDTIKRWDPPDQRILISPTEKQMILDDIKANFVSGGHTLDLE